MKSVRQRGRGLGAGGASSTLFFLRPISGKTGLKKWAGGGP